MLKEQMMNYMKQRDNHTKWNINDDLMKMIESEEGEIIIQSGI